MDCSSTPIPYSRTQKFSQLINDYLDRKPELLAFSSHPVSPEGIAVAMKARDEYPTDREALVGVFRQQYEGKASSAQEKNINALLSPHTYTITTAHQPNIFTGYLYLTYKILHVIKLAEDLRLRFPQADFVPVYYIGSEDNDLEELGQLTISGSKLIWDTKQTGAVGRMTVDDALLKVLDQIEAQLGVEAHGPELIAQLRAAYRKGLDLASATAAIINTWMGAYGLLVLQPDVAALKKVMIPVFREELLHQSSLPVVTATSEQIGQHYKTQIHPREINLFYLDEGMRERITHHDGVWQVEHTTLKFTQAEILELLDKHPEKFSPNVVLRPVYQSTILPDVAFVGGGAELSYWMQLHDLFSRLKRPFPVLLLRNSFLLMDQRQEKKLARIGFPIGMFFNDPKVLADSWMERNGELNVRLDDEVRQLQLLFEQLSAKAMQVDATLSAHVAALRKEAEKGLEGLEKKLVRAEKRKYSDQLRQLASLHEELFPGNGLQERVESVLPFLAKYGVELISLLHKHSFTFEQQFCVLGAMA